MFVNKDFLFVTKRKVFRREILIEFPFGSRRKEADSEKNVFVEDKKRRKILGYKFEHFLFDSVTLSS